MMTSLPPDSDFNKASTDKDTFHARFLQCLGFLRSLLGTDGEISTARAHLGIKVIATLDEASEAEAVGGVVQSRWMSPLRVRQALDAFVNPSQMISAEKTARGVYEHNPNTVTSVTESSHTFTWDGGDCLVEFSLSIYLHSLYTTPAVIRVRLDGDTPAGGTIIEGTGAQIQNFSTRRLIPALPPGGHTVSVLVGGGINGFAQTTYTVNPNSSDLASIPGATVSLVKISRVNT